MRSAADRSEEFTDRLAANIELWAPLTKEACIVRVALLGFDHLGQILAQLW